MNGTTAPDGCGPGPVGTPTYMFILSSTFPIKHTTTRCQPALHIPPTSHRNDNNKTRVPAGAAPSDHNHHHDTSESINILPQQHQEQHQNLLTGLFTDIFSRVVYTRQYCKVGALNERSTGHWLDDKDDSVPLLLILVSN